MTSPLGHVLVGKQEAEVRPGTWNKLCQCRDYTRSSTVLLKTLTCSHKAITKCC